MTDGLDLPLHYRGQLEALLREHVPGVEVWAYGSRVNGMGHEASHLDLVLRGPTLAPLGKGFFDLLEAIEKSNIPILIQAHDWARLPESFHREIERDYVVVQKGAKQASQGVAEEGWLYHPDFPDHWDKRPLYSLAQWVNGLAFRNIQFSPTGKPVIKIAEIKGGISGQTKFTHQNFDESVRVRPGDLLFSWSGQPETSIDAFWWHGLEGWLNQHIFRVTTGTDVDRTFFYYLLRYLKPNFVEIARNKQTTGLGHVTRRDLENIEAAVPRLPEQRAIAHILGTLDDKIELNRRMNETLEAMARALFKSWFVDFDPVRAKAALKRSSLITPPLRGSRQAKGASPQARRWGEIKRRYCPQTLRKARTLRQARTDAEGLLWHFLRNKQLDGYKFRRQQPIGPYIADFACLSRKLLIELAGSQHAERRAYDEKCDEFLQEKGYWVLRFWNNEVFEHCFGVLERVYEALTSPLPHQPSPVGSASACLSCGRRQATPPRGGSDWSVERARAYLPAARGLAQAGLAGMDDSIADLFPDRLVDSELGPIPEGWEVGKSSDIVTRLRDNENPVASPDTIFSHFSIPAYDEGQTPKRELGKGIKSAKSRVPQGVVLLSKLNPEIERVWLVDVTSDERAVCSTEFLVLQSRPPFSRSYTYCLARSLVFRQQIESLVTGTSKSHQRAPAKAVLSLDIVIPTARVIEGFETCTSELLTRGLAFRRESRTLVALRDALQLKLVSGAVRLTVASAPLKTQA